MPGDPLSPCPSTSPHQTAPAASAPCFCLLFYYFQNQESQKESEVYSFDNQFSVERRTKVVAMTMGQGPRTAQQGFLDLQEMSTSLVSLHLKLPATQFYLIPRRYHGECQCPCLRHHDCDIKTSSTSCVVFIATVRNGARHTTNKSPPGFGRELHFLETSLQLVLVPKPNAPLA